MTKRLSIFAGVAAAALTVSAPAFAHVELVRSNPANNATLRASPKSITLQFDRKLGAKGAGFELTMPAHGGMKVPVRTELSRDGKRLIGTPAKPLMNGAYKITWTTTASDGHRVTGDVSFKVG